MYLPDSGVNGDSSSKEISLKTLGDNIVSDMGRWGSLEYICTQCSLCNVMEVTFLAALSCVVASEGEGGQMHKRKADVDNDKQLV